MIHEFFPVGPLGCNCSIVGDAGEAIVIDPGGDLGKILETVATHGLTVKQIIVTHAHIDHIAGAQQLKKLTGAPVFYNQLDLPLVEMMEMQAGWLGVQTPEVAPPDADAADGTQVAAGEAKGIVLHTPGHTEGSIVIHFPEQHLLIAGDTLFAGSIGRTDLPGGDFGKIMNSLQGTLMQLPDDTRVIAGHGPATYIGKERDSNPFITNR